MGRYATYFDFPAVVLPRSLSTRVERLQVRVGMLAALVAARYYGVRANLTDLSRIFLIRVAIVTLISDSLNQLIDAHQALDGETMFISLCHNDSVPTVLVTFSYLGLICGKLDEHGKNKSNVSDLRIVGEKSLLNENVDGGKQGGPDKHDALCVAVRVLNHFDQ